MPDTQAIRRFLCDSRRYFGCAVPHIATGARPATNRRHLSAGNPFGIARSLPKNINSSLETKA